MPKYCLMAAVFLLMGGSAAQAQVQTISGPATAGDGDSLTIGSHKIRLSGIDAPELDQSCHTGDESWACGERARGALADLVAGEHIDCRVSALDQYGRSLATCSTAFLNLNEAMVELGWAIAYTQYSLDYEEAQARARQRRTGIWNSTFTMPSEYRKSRPGRPERSEQPRNTEVSVAPVARVAGCTIKGNRNRRGEWIYHMPGMPYYDVTRAEEFFCTEQQAVAAGYRRAIVRR